MLYLSLSKLYPRPWDTRVRAYFPFQVVPIHPGGGYSSHVGYMMRDAKLRVSEAAALTWGDVRRMRGDSG